MIRLQLHGYIVAKKSALEYSHGMWRNQHACTIQENFFPLHTYTLPGLLAELLTLCWLCTPLCCCNNLVSAERMFCVGV